MKEILFLFLTLMYHDGSCLKHFFIMLKKYPLISILLLKKSSKKKSSKIVCYQTLFHSTEISVSFVSLACDVQYNFSDDGNVLYLLVQCGSHYPCVWLLKIWHLTNETEKLIFKLHSISLNRHTWLVASMTALGILKWWFNWAVFFLLYLC